LRHGGAVMVALNYSEEAWKAASTREAPCSACQMTFLRKSVPIEAQTTNSFRIGSYFV